MYIKGEKQKIEDLQNYLILFLIYGIMCLMKKIFKIPQRGLEVEVVIYKTHGFTDLDVKVADFKMERNAPVMFKHLHSMQNAI